MSVGIVQPNALADRGVDGVVYLGRKKTERFDDPDGKYGVYYAGSDFRSFAKLELLFTNLLVNRVYLLLINS